MFLLSWHLNKRNESMLHKSLLGKMNLFHKWGPRKDNLNWANFFRHKGSFKVKPFISWFQLVNILKYSGCRLVFASIHEIEGLIYINFIYCHGVNLLKKWLSMIIFVLKVNNAYCMFLLAIKSLKGSFVCACPCYVSII